MERWKSSDDGHSSSFDVELVTVRPAVGDESAHKYGFISSIQSD